MATSNCGIPGSGKTFLATHFAIQHYQKQNSLLLKLFRYIKKQPILVNNVYSNYPILLDKKRNIYSNKISLFDLDLKHKFNSHSKIIIDEIQLYFDSMDYKNFPKDIGYFNQMHRHFDIDDIIYTSQSPNRIPIKLRNILSAFSLLRVCFKFPFLPFGIVYWSDYYVLEDYHKWNHPKKESKTYDVKNHFSLFNFKKVYGSYNTKYLSPLIEDLPLLNNGTWESLSPSKEQLISIFKLQDLYK